jgi:hypothetical protein
MTWGEPPFLFGNEGRLLVVYHGRFDTRPWYHYFLNFQRVLGLSYGLADYPRTIVVLGFDFPQVHHFVSRMKLVIVRQN